MLWLIALCALLLALMGALAWLAYARRSSAAEHEAELAHWQRVAEEVGGLTLSQTSTGRPRLRGNVAGIEIENSANCEVHGNTAEDNTGGILVFELPGLTEQGMGTLVHDNIVRNNNTPNFAETGSIVALVPTGTGLFVMVAKDVEVRDNTITGNNGTGIAIISWYTQMALTMDPLPAPPYDPQSVTIHVHGNTFMSNGAMPSMTAGDPLNTVSGLLGVSTLEDILWDGFVPMSGGPTDVLCVHDNGTASFRNIDVPGSFGMSTTDATPHDCTFPARPAVQL